MTPAVEDFDVVCTADGVRGAPLDVGVFGTPLHETTDSLIDRYVDSTESAFLEHEQRHSCGNYLLFDARDPNSVRLITAPGYASGYLYPTDSSTRITTLLTNAVETWAADGGSIAEEYLRLFLTKQRPFQGTPFAGIDSLRPATVYRIESGSVTGAAGYLTRRGDSVSVEKAMRACADALSGQSVTVMFSGGLDSLSWYLILRSQLGADRVDLATVDWRPGSRAQGPYLARPVADRLGDDLHVVSFEDGWMTNDRAVLDHVTSWMKRDITIGRNPNHALVAFDGVNDAVVNLTNNESLLTLQMNHLYWRNYVNGTKSLWKNVYAFGHVFFNQYASNPQYTSGYMRRWPYRLAFFALVWPLMKAANAVVPSGLNLPLAKAAVGDIDLSRRSIQEAIVGKATPNLRLDEHARLVELETDTLTTIAGDHDVHHMARLLYYYAHMAWTSNALEKLPLGGLPTRTYLPTTWGPLVSASLFDDLTLTDAVNPRHELLAIVEKETGQSFDELRRLPGSQAEDANLASIQSYKRDVYSSIVVEHGELLSPDRLEMTGRLDESTRKWYELVVADVLEDIEDGRGPFDSILKASRMINLELLLGHST